ncbi:MAG TPA: HEAT repeat domain-containing protein [Gemmataceae bacterium]|nr:HEAT repeat domain-containing protein [Gemmataceae bacterium]
MAKSIFVPVVTFALIASVAPNAAAQDQPPSVKTLIEQLGSKKFAERAKASQMLEALGPKALPELRQALKHQDPEVRARVQKLVAVFEAILALAPKRVSLQFENEPLSKVLQALHKQTGYEITANKHENDLCRIAVKDVTFWEALEELSRSLDLTITTAPHDKGIQLVRAEARSPFVIVNGPFRLEAKRFQEHRDLKFDVKGANAKAGKHGNLLTLTFSVLAEPKFIFLSAGQANVDVALDEFGQKFGKPPPDPTKKPGFLEKLHIRPFEEIALLMMERSSDKAKRVKTLRGSIPVRLVVERKPVVITERFLESTDMKFKLGADELTILEARQDNKDKHVEFRLRIPEGLKSTDWHERVVLEDAKGKRFQPDSWGTIGINGSRSITLGYSAAANPKVGPPAKLIMEDWISMSHEIPFELKDVPLP